MTQVNKHQNLSFQENLKHPNMLTIFLHNTPVQSSNVQVNALKIANLNYNTKEIVSRANKVIGCLKTTR